MAVRKTDENQEGVHDPADAGKLYPAHLHRYLLGRLRNREDAADLAQEAYLRYLQLPDTGAVRKPSGYLFRIAFNLISEWRLRRDRSPVTFSSDLSEKRSPAWPDPAADSLEQLISRERLEKVLEHIPVTYRRVLLMSKCDGLSNSQIAERLKITPDTVARYLVRATAFARKAPWD